jgi:flavorubredoxin
MSMVEVKVEQLCTDPELYIIRVDDDRIRSFEAAWEIPEGITYNAYLMKLKDAVVLFDGSKEEYTDIFLNALKKIVDPKEITHIIVHHTEPDHSGALPKLLE